MSAKARQIILDCVEWSSLIWELLQKSSWIGAYKL